MFFLMRACMHEFIKKEKKKGKKTTTKKPHTPLPQILQRQKFLLRVQLCYTHVLDLNTLSLRRIIENTLL